jgi:hypothetical protein
MDFDTIKRTVRSRSQTMDRIIAEERLFYKKPYTQHNE